MPREKSPAQQLLDEIVGRAATPTLKQFGFRKSALNFHRRHQEVVQVVNLQSSQGSDWNEKQFYVNVGLAFDVVCQLTDTEILERPKEHECESRSTRDRLENLLDDTQAVWSVTANCDAKSVACRLQVAIERLADELEIINDARAYREHRWFNRGRPRKENAQILYVLGDVDGSWREVEQLCTRFADRGAINRPKSLGCQSLRMCIGFDSGDAVDCGICYARNVHRRSHRFGGGFRRQDAVSRSRNRTSETAPGLVMQHMKWACPRGLRAARPA